MIGIFDSGIGGLTVVRALQQERSDLSFVYLGDTARTPYGNKSAETVRGYSEEAVRFLKEKGAEVIIIACNTASSVATESLREIFPDTPIFEVVTPAVAEAARKSTTGKIGVIATHATVRSRLYGKRLKEISPEMEVHSRPAPLLVPFVEEGWTDAPETEAVIGKYLAPFRDLEIDTLILGCTHYPMLKPLIKNRVGEHVRLIDSSEAAVKAFCATLDADSALDARLDKQGNSSFYVTDMTPNFASLASEWLGREITPLVTEI